MHRDATDDGLHRWKTRLKKYQGTYALLVKFISLQVNNTVLFSIFRIGYKKAILN